MHVAFYSFVRNCICCRWVRCVAFDPSNEWFATGSGDRTIKLWDTASGQLKLTLTGHIEQVTGVAVSPRHPYMFSCGLDKQVKCWDLEQNKVRDGVQLATITGSRLCCGIHGSPAVVQEAWKCFTSAACCLSSCIVCFA